MDDAKQSLDVAFYDFRLTGEAKSEVVEAVLRAAKRVPVRFAFDHTKATSNAEDKATLGNDPAPRGTKAFVEENFPPQSQVQTRPIAGSHLMHSKFIIRDGTAVWTGSANFTNDAWTLQENNVVMVTSPQLARHYLTDFTSLWDSGDIKGTGKNDYGVVSIDGADVEFGFSPGEGSAVASLFVDAIRGAGADGTVYLASMVLSSGPILGALVDHLQGGGKLVGVYDATQMNGVEHDWQKTKAPSPKLALWRHVKPHLVGKTSTPYTPTSRHDFMHNKLLATDHVVLTGSFNLSRNAESNAENALAIHDQKLARSYVEYIKGLVQRYA